MSILTIPGGTFDDAAHIYRDEKGQFVPSLTQILGLCGFYDYSMVPRDVMEKAAERGTLVHSIAEMHARYGCIDETWVTDEVKPYVDAYLKFIAETGFTPDPDVTEQPMIANFHGMKFGVKPDVIGKRNGSKHPTVMEIKTVATAQPTTWAIQTVGQAIAKFGEHRYVEAIRQALQLKPDGNYRLFTFGDHLVDGRRFYSALDVVWTRLDMGQRLWEAI